MAYVSLDSDQIKKANKKHKYTREQVEKLTEDHMPASLRKHAKMTLDAM